MEVTSDLLRADVFSECLYEKMKSINAGVADLELYEFRYCLDNFFPAQGGWASVALDPVEDIDQRINERDFYLSIKLRPRAGDKIVLDETIARLTSMLFAGLVTGAYSEEWLKRKFYFDVRGFYFLPRTVYFTDEVVAHFGGKPYRTFEQKQRAFESYQAVGYSSFKAANAEIDQVFMDSLVKLTKIKGTPILMTLAGPTAAGKTEIVERLHGVYAQAGMKISSIAMDDLLIDNSYREDHGIVGMVKEAYHFELFMDSLRNLLRGQKVTIPRYISEISSHDPSGTLRAGCTSQEIEPADIIFIEGNFPFQIPEVSSLIGLKVVYLTDDPIRLKRKWKRDIDYRKKYDPNYFRNRYFRTQFLRANDCYHALAAVCDLLVDTTGAAIWATAEIQRYLE